MSEAKVKQQPDAASIAGVAVASRKADARAGHHGFESIGFEIDLASVFADVEV